MVPSAQASVLQGSPSWQAGGPETQPVVASQRSTPSQKMPSSHIASQGTWLHVSVVGSQVSVVQAMPSSHGALLRVCVQPVPGTQASTVQSSPSSQSASFGVFVQPVGVQVSVVQAMPSSHCASLTHGGAPEEEDDDEEDDDDEEEEEDALLAVELAVDDEVVTEVEPPAPPCPDGASVRALRAPQAVAARRSKPAPIAVHDLVTRRR